MEVYVKAEPKPELKVKNPTPVQQIRLNISKLVELSKASQKIESLRRLGLLEIDQTHVLVTKTSTMIDETKEEITKTLQYI